MAYAQGGHDGQALALSHRTAPLAAPAQPPRRLVPRMPRVRDPARRRWGKHLLREEVADQLEGPTVQASGSADADGDDPSRYLSLLVVILAGIAVAHLRLGPSSSATTSTTDRALSLLAVQVRCWRQLGSRLEGQAAGG